LTLTTACLTLTAVNHLSGYDITDRLLGGSALKVPEATDQSGLQGKDCGERPCLTRRMALAVFAGLWSPSPLRAADPPFRFGLTPVFLTSDLVLLEGLQLYLSQAMGRPVQLVLRRTYQEITAELVSGQLDAAWICGYPFVAYKDRLSLVAVPVWRGRNVYQAYLLTGRDRSATNIDDLRGDIHAFSDPDSNSGFLVTRALLAERGQRPEGFFGRSFFTYGHRNVVRAVASGLAQSGSVDGYVWEVLNEAEPELTARTQAVWRSEWTGFPPVATAAIHADALQTRQLQNALSGMSRDPAGLRLLGMLRLDGFGIADPSLFDGIARRVETVRRAG
jgi:phosphonate transport system substrate-binding protein